MDFSNRSLPNTQQQNTTPAAAPSTPPARIAAPKHKQDTEDNNKWSRISGVVMVVAIVALLIGLIGYISFGNNSEDRYVNTSKLQAVFLQTGQLYFGNIKSLNSKYLVLDNIYYLQQTTSTATSTTTSTASNVSLVKLGCELHQPYDQMVINRDQVTFWENLQDSGQVSQAVKNFVKANPNGQKCSDVSTNGSTTTNVQNATGAATAPTSTSTSSTSSTSTTTKK